MRIESTASVDWFDLTPIVGAIDAAHWLWGEFEFEPDGRWIDPEVGRAVDDFRLIDGRHRARNSGYELTSALEGDKPPMCTQMRLVEDTPQRFAADFTGVTAPFEASVAADHSTNLSATASARGKVVPILEALEPGALSAFPRWVAKGPLKVDAEATVQPRAVAEPVAAGQVSGRAGRYPFQATLTATTVGRQIETTVVAEVSGRWTGRLVVAGLSMFAKSRLQKALDESLLKTLEVLRAEVLQLAEQADAAGGYRELMRAELSAMNRERP